VTLDVTLSRCVCVRRISIGGEGNVLYPVLSSYHYFMCRRVAPPPPGAGSRDRKWSYNKVDDVNDWPTSFDSHRRMSSPILDYDNVFDSLMDAGFKSSPFVFDKGPARQPLRDLPADRPWEKNRVKPDDNVSVVWNADKSITMSLALPNDAESKENRVPAQQQQPPRRHRNESFMMISSPARVVSPSPSRSLTQRVWTPRPITPPRQHTEKSAADLWLSRPTPAATDLSKFGPLPPDVLKIISPPSDAESLDSLSPTHLTKRKSQ